MDNKISVGRIVFYKARGSADGKFPSKDRAAIVTDVRIVEIPFLDENGEKRSGPLVKEQVRLAVLNPEGLFFSDWLDEGINGGEWSWPVITK